MKKLTWSEFRKVMWDFNEEHGYTTKGNKEHLEGVVVFKAESWYKPYTETQRSYRVSSDNKAFLPNQLGNSIFGDCLDEKDLGVRLDWYMHDNEKPWEVEYCYLLEA